MRPRGFWSTFAMLSSITGLAFALLSSWLFSLVMDWKFSEFFVLYGLWGGIAFGLLFGLIMAFFMKAITLSMTFKDKETFLSQLNVALAEIGYHPQSQTGNFLTYKPSFQAGLLAGRISVQIEQSSATVVGPSTYIKKLQKRIS